jgi:hypothetical protein
LRAIDVFQGAGVKRVATADHGQSTNDQDETETRSHAPILPTRAKSNGHDAR